MYRAFSILDPPLRSGSLVVEPHGVPLDDFAWIQGVGPDGPIPIRRLMGREPGDIVLGGSPAFLLISRSFQQALQGAEISGWTTYSIHPAADLTESLDGYMGLAVTGRCQIDDARSIPSLMPPPEPGGTAYRVWKGLYFDPSSWDGSDIFLEPGHAAVFLTSRCRDALEAARLSDVAFTALADFENYRLGTADRGA